MTTVTSDPLFELFLVVGVESEPTRDVRVRWQIPESGLVASDVQRNIRSLSQFCFPRLSTEKPRAYLSCTRYMFALMLENGEHLYGFCYKLLPPPSLSSRYDTGERFPEVLCLVSRRFEMDLQFAIMDCIVARRLIDPPSVKELLSNILKTNLPQYGESFHLRSSTLGVLSEYKFTRPLIGEKGYANVSLLHLSSKMLHYVMGAVMCESRIIFVASSEETLTSVIFSIVQLLYPFIWQHMFVPLMPEHLLEYLGAPSPFLVGVLRALTPKLEGIPMGSVLMVDLDKNEISASEKLIPYGKVDPNDNSLRRTRSKTDEIQRIGSVFASDILSIHKRGNDERNLRIAWISMNMYMFGYCDRFLDPKTHLIHKENYLSSVLDPGMHEFMSVFLHTQMFSNFVERTVFWRRGIAPTSNKPGANRQRQAVNERQSLEDSLFFSALRSIQGLYTYDDVKYHVSQFVALRNYSADPKVTQDLSGKLSGTIKTTHLEHLARTSFNLVLMYAYADIIFEVIRTISIKNWKMAYQCMRLLIYLIETGCEAIITLALRNIYHISKCLRFQCPSAYETHVFRKLAKNVYRKLFDSKMLIWHRSPKLGHALFQPSRQREDAEREDGVRLTSVPFPKFAQIHMYMRNEIDAYQSSSVSIPQYAAANGGPVVVVPPPPPPKPPLPSKPYSPQAIRFYPPPPPRAAPTASRSSSLSSESGDQPTPPPPPPLSENGVNGRRSSSLGSEVSTSHIHPPPPQPALVVEAGAKSRRASSIESASSQNHPEPPPPPVPPRAAELVQTSTEAATKKPPERAPPIRQPSTAEDSDDTPPPLPTSPKPRLRPSPPKKPSKVEKLKKQFEQNSIS